MKFILLITTVLLTSCTGIYELFSCNTQNLRSFNFSYEVQINPTMGKKLEMWLPFPISNEVQTITNLEIDAGIAVVLADQFKMGNKEVTLARTQDDITITSANITLPYFKYAYLNDSSRFLDKIVVVAETTSTGSVEY